MSVMSLIVAWARANVSLYPLSLSIEVRSLLSGRLFKVHLLFFKFFTSISPAFKLLLSLSLSLSLVYSVLFSSSFLNLFKIKSTGMVFGFTKVPTTTKLEMKQVFLLHYVLVIGCSKWTELECNSKHTENIHSLTHTNNPLHVTKWTWRYETNNSLLHHVHISTMHPLSTLLHLL